MFCLNHSCILFTLTIQYGRYIRIFFLRFNNPNHFFANKECIICIPAIARPRICRPFCNCKILAFSRTNPFRIADFIRIRIPTNFAKLLIDQFSCLCFGKFYVHCFFISNCPSCIIRFSNLLNSLQFNKQHFVTLFQLPVFLFQLIHTNGNIHRRDISYRIITVISICLHIPYTKFIQQRQII